MFVSMEVLARALALVALGAIWSQAAGQERRIRSLWDVPTGGRRIAPGADVSGALTHQDPVTEQFDGPPLRFQAYEFQASAGAQLRFRAFAADFRLSLLVEAGYDYSVYDNPDVGEVMLGEPVSDSCNVQLAVTIPRAGRHKLIVGAPDGRLGNGQYRLRFVADSIPPPELPCPHEHLDRRIRSAAELAAQGYSGGPILQIGTGRSWHRGELVNSDALDSADLRWEAIKVVNSVSPRPVRVRITVWSPHFSPILDIRGAGLERGLQSDPGAFIDSGRCWAVLGATLRPRELYYILISARERRALGSYSVTVVGHPAIVLPPPCPQG